MKQETEDIGYEGKYILDYVKEQQKLDIEERAAWRDTQKRQVEIRMAELQAEDKKRADEIHMTEMQVQAEAEEKKRADEIKIQIAQIEAKIEAVKELKIK